MRFKKGEMCGVNRLGLYAYEENEGLITYNKKRHTVKYAFLVY